MMGGRYWIQLKIILWKNIIVNRRYWSLTIFEILNPTMFLVLLGIFTCKVAHSGDSSSSFLCRFNISEKPVCNYDLEFRVVYFPTTTFVNTIMNTTRRILNLEMTGLHNATQLSSYLNKSTNNKELLVEFFVDHDKKPKKLRYLIKPPHRHLCEWLKNTQIFQEIRPQDVYHKLDKDFMPLQVAIDVSFLKYYRAEKHYQIKVKEMPVYNHTKHIFNLIKQCLPSCIVCGYQFLYLTVLHRIVEEKQSGLKELMKIMGLHSEVLWLGWVVYTSTVIFISSLFASVILNILGCSLLKYSNRLVLGLFLFLYTNASTNFCFAISSFCSKPIKATVLGLLLWLITYVVPNKMLPSMQMSQTSTFIVLLMSPNSVINYGLDMIVTFEEQSVGIQWSNLSEKPGSMYFLSMENVFALFVANSIIYLIITLYFEKVLPGPYGISKPFYFPFLFFNNYFIFNFNKVDCSDESYRHFYKIEEVHNLEVGIRLKNISKEYGKTLAVDNVSMNIYNGEITVLSGPNGAGKTTIMSIITGMIGATSGQVIIHGENIKSNLTKIRKNLGVCPQFNLQFPLLTVMEHLMFFGMLKGLSPRKARLEAMVLMNRLNLEDIKNCLACSLSNGLKRRLSFGMAIISDPKVLILDEPTSGLDPSSRRMIWDILLSMKSNRVILLTSHNMEEADVVGDRIAILNSGRLVCYGTPMFLKKEFGAGYHLEIIYERTCEKTGTIKSSKEAFEDAEKIVELVKDALPSAYLQSHIENNLTFILPHESKSNFSKLFEALEKSISILQIVNIRLSVTTLEEIFLRIGDFISKGQLTHAGIDDIRKKFSNLYPKTLTGYEKVKVQFNALCLKRYWIEKLKWKTKFVQIFVVISITIFLLYVSEETDNCIYLSRRKYFTLPKYQKSRIYYNIKCNNSLIRTLYKKMASKSATHLLPVKSVHAHIYKSPIGNLKYMSVSTAFVCTHSFVVGTAFFFKRMISAGPISINLMTNTMLQYRKGEAYSIKAAVQYPPFNQCTIRYAKYYEVAAYWATLFPLGILLYSAWFLIYPLSEKIRRSKGMQLMSGVHFLLYWAVFYLWNLVLQIIGIIIIILTILIYQRKKLALFNNTEDFKNLVSILMAYGHSISMLSFIYPYKLVSFRVSSFVGMNLYVSYLMSIVVILIKLIRNTQCYFLIYLFHLHPQFALVYSVYKLIFQLVLEHNTLIIKENCSIDTSVSTSVLLMYLSSLLSFIVLILLETNVARKLWTTFDELLKKEVNVKIEFRNKNQSDVKDESERVTNLFHLEKKFPDKILPTYKNSMSPDVLLVKNIQKYNSQISIKNISFGVRAGDCFGLLGTNGSGKTTLFRVLTGDLPLTDGDARIFCEDRFLYLSNNSKEFLKVIGYCPQDNANIDLLTGRQNLYFYAKLRGVALDTINKEVNMWLKLFGLDVHANRLCKDYSCGNRRKLCLATALVGSPLLLLLDEPSNRVDPVSRRKLIDIINIIQRQEDKPCIVLSSHSMDECEALCNRLAIMQNGQFECFGSLPSLKMKYGEGYTIILKLRVPLKYKTRIDSNDSLIQTIDGSPEIKDVMSDFKLLYGDFCTLEDKHNVLLHYHLLTKTKKLSELFKEIENLQKRHKIIEDYIVAEITLDEVFMSLARLHALKEAFKY